MSEGEREQTCGNCRWWDRAWPDAAEGKCRVNAPVVANQFQWPRTKPADWCGEYARKE